MYSNKENVNMLTALLASYGVYSAVVCPGSRNAPIVHNLNEHPDIVCYPVTDERSAGFFALGMALATQSAVAVCVTSGSAMLNVLPAVAEAFYQKVPLVVISADRPAAWIGQLDGQTIPQADAFGWFVRKAVSLPEPHDETERWHCNRLINEALFEANHRGGGPVLINVPISEPLYQFSVEKLPEERRIERLENASELSPETQHLLAHFVASERPMIVLGQIKFNENLIKIISQLREKVIILNEPLSADGGVNFDEVLSVFGEEEDFVPDFVLYFGETLVSKRLKIFLRKAPKTQIFSVRPDGEVCDTFTHLSGVIEADETAVLRTLANLLSAESGKCQEKFLHLWNCSLRDANKCVSKLKFDYSQMEAVKCFEEKLQTLAKKFRVHYANSTAVRLANIFARHYVYCNRGVNGIEGSVSTAAGMSSALPDEKVFCVVGDLSFFYDQNALWNNNLRGNFRILLINNSCGGIFGKFEGLKHSAARNDLVMAQHNATAQGICMQNNVKYFSIKNEQELRNGMDWLLAEKSERPMLLEVFTDAETDWKILDDYYKMSRYAKKLEENRRV